MATREDLELWLILTNPSEARDYIRTFDWACQSHLRPTEITLNSGRKIDFRHMTDDDAVVAAMELLRTIEIPMVMSQKQFELEH